MSGAINLHPECRGDDDPGLIGAGQERFECDETDDTCDEGSKETPLVLENLHCTLWERYSQRSDGEHRRQSNLLLHRYF